MRTLDLPDLSLTPALAADALATDFTVLLTAGRDAVPDDCARTVPLSAVLAAAREIGFSVAKLPLTGTVFFADTDFTADLAGAFFAVAFTAGFLAISFGAGLAAALVGWACGLVFLTATLAADAVLLRDLAGLALALAATVLLALRTAGLVLLAAGLLAFLALVAATLFFVVFLVTVAFIALILKELPDAC